VGGAHERRVDYNHLGDHRHTDGAVGPSQSSPGTGPRCCDRVGSRRCGDVLSESFCIDRPIEEVVQFFTNSCYLFIYLIRIYYINPRSVGSA
jgi:hypothetical protein